MQDAPTAEELLDAVRVFIDENAASELTGHAAFHARVAANALSIVERELDLGPRSHAEEHERLIKLLGHDGDLVELNTELAQKIRTGEMTLDTKGLRDHLWQTTLDKVAIDQPKYSGYRAALARR